MLFRYNLEPKSPIMTPLMSDTIFGHFCWAVLYKNGDNYLETLLDSYDKEKPAPVLFSSAVLSGFLPRPALPPLNRDTVKKFVNKHYGTDQVSLFNGVSEIKRWNGVSTLSLVQWTELKNDYSDLRLYELFKSDGKNEDSETFVKEVSASNFINRITGTVDQEGGGLFQREKWWYHQGIRLDLYVEINDESLNDIVKWFLLDYLPEYGFGADKSIGMGSLDISFDDDFEPEIFQVNDANARLSLSAASFPDMGKYKVFYRLMTKFGKLGGSFAVSSPTGGNPKPFKKPILMYEPGAVFLTNKNPNTNPLLKNVHSDERVRHCGIPVTIPFKIREENIYASTTI